jgi:PAS domain S-box-containing protein
MLEHAADGVLVLDAEGAIRDSTTSAEQLFGCTAGALRSRRWTELLDPADVPAVEVWLREVLAAPEKPMDISVRGVPAGAPAQPLDVQARAITAAEAPVVVLTLRRASEGPLADEALMTQEAQFQRLFEDDLTGDFIATPAGRIVACNGAFAEILGYSSVEEATALNYEELFVDPAVHAVLLQRLRQEKVLKRLELELVRRDGRAVHVIANVIGAFDDAGELVETRGYLFDITAQRLLADERTQLLVRERAARALAEAAERRTAFLAEIGSVLDASLDYRQTLTNLARLVVPTLADYCLVDEATSEGGSRRVAVAHVDADLETTLLADDEYGPDTDAATHPVMSVLRTGTPVLVPEVTRLALERLARDAEHAEQLRRLGVGSFIIVPLPARGRILGALTLVSSTSGRRFTMHDVEMAEAVAERAALAVDNARLYSRAQQAAQAREEVLAFVSHDLRNPLATILLNASALLETLPPERLHADERDQLEWIARSSEQMNRMIQDLLEIARIEAGRLLLRPFPSDLGSLLRDACILLQPLAAAKELRLELGAVPSGLVASIDQERFLRVLSNLIGNAIKFTSAGGSIRVTAER